jgi:hypothetical protein
LSEAETELFAPTADGRRVRLGGTRKQSIFTRPDPDPARRKVTTLHPSFGLGDVPRRVLSSATPASLTAVPESFTRLEPLAAGPAHVWSYQQTDPNRHVHAMEYLRVVEAFVTDELGRRGRFPADYLIERARLLFRRPCFSGDWYRVVGSRFGDGTGREEIVAEVHTVAGAIGEPANRPATLVRLSLRPSSP